LKWITVTEHYITTPTCCCCSCCLLAKAKLMD